MLLQASTWAISTHHESGTPSEKWKTIEYRSKIVGNMGNPKILRASRTLECISATLLCLLESELHVAHGLFKGLQPPYFQLPWQSRGLAKSHVLWCFRCDSRLGVQPRGSCSTSPSLCRMLSDSALRLWCACCHCAFIRSSSFTWPSKPALCCESTVRF